jgi:hypothetical protein
MHHRDMNRPATRSPATSVLRITTLWIVVVMAANILAGNGAAELPELGRDKW